MRMGDLEPAERIDIDREDDGRWIAEMLSLPGVLAYGETEAQAVANVRALALRVIAGRKIDDDADRE